MSKKAEMFIEDIDEGDRDNLSYHQFVGITPNGYQFTVQMNGLDHTHAYRRLNTITGKELNLPAIIGA